jgi:hypothetical protein
VPLQIERMTMDRLDGEVARGDELTEGPERLKTSTSRLSGSAPFVRVSLFEGFSELLAIDRIENQMQPNQCHQYMKDIF